MCDPCNKCIEKLVQEHKDFVAKIWHQDPNQIDMEFVKNVFKFVALDHPVPIIAIAVSNEGKRLYKKLLEYADRVNELVGISDIDRDPGFDFYVEGVSMAYTALYNYALGMIQAACITLRTSLEAIIKGLIASSVKAYNTAAMSHLLEEWRFVDMLEFLRDYTQFRDCIRKYWDKLREAYRYFSDYAHAHGMTRRILERKGLSSYPLPRILYEPEDEKEFKRIVAIVEDMIGFVNCVNDVYARRLEEESREVLTSH